MGLPSFALPSRAGLAALALLASCRDADTVASIGAALPLPPSAAGASGCVGPDVGFQPVPAPLELVLSTLVLGPDSRIAASRATPDELYATGAGASVVRLEVGAMGGVTETEIVPAGVVDAFLAGLGFASPARLVGIAVLDAQTLLVADATSNSLIAIDRTITSTANDLVLAVGFATTTPGFADGPPQFARFSFTGPVSIVPVEDGRVFVTDPGNHAVRVVTVDPPAVLTVAGFGTPGVVPVDPVGEVASTELQEASLDTPSGLAVNCSNQLVLAESGAAGTGGHLLRALSVGEPSFFGGFEGAVDPLAGDGTAATIEGQGTEASVAAPVAVVTSAEGEAYWVDGATGVLRRLEPVDLAADCPLHSDCGTAVAAGGDFTPGAPVSLALTESGRLYALDPAVPRLLLINP